MKKFTREELAGFRGDQGGPVYVAYDGKVYDVSDSPSWVDGEHQAGEHYAGHDLTAEMADAPHDPDMLDGFPVVGELE